MRDNDTILPYFLQLGQTDTPIKAAIVDSIGDPVDLSLATVVFNMYNEVDGVLKVTEGACNVWDAVNGKVQYEPVADDVDTVSEFFYEYKVTIAGVVGYYPPRPKNDVPDFVEDNDVQRARIIVTNNM